MKAYHVRAGGRTIFTIEILDERPVGFSIAVPELAIYTFGKTEEQAIERILRHVVEKYEDLLDSSIPLNENEERFLNLYRTKIIPALFEEHLRHSPSPELQRQFQHVLKGENGWHASFLEGLRTCLEHSAI